MQQARDCRARDYRNLDAEFLGMATRTASTHLSNIYQKLEVHSRGELADLVREKGLLDD
ncbi:MAG: LuxR C-terminal-related transcriptional regulator [Gemmatimonadota bacterium]|nr:LuxR C-terminal-related transcriptional regulator [Gemmatimonadota bacterium]